MKTKQILDVVVNNYGNFDKATLNGLPISEMEIYDLINVKSKRGLKMGKLRGTRLEYFLNIFKENNPDYIVEVWERNIN